MLTRLPELFSRNDQAMVDARNHEQQVTDLYAERTLDDPGELAEKNLASSLSPS